MAVLDFVEQAGLELNNSPPALFIIVFNGQKAIEKTLNNCNNILKIYILLCLSHTYYRVCDNIFESYLTFLGVMGTVRVLLYSPG